MATWNELGFEDSQSMDGEGIQPVEEDGTQPLEMAGDFLNRVDGTDGTDGTDGDLALSIKRAMEFAVIPQPDDVSRGNSLDFGHVYVEENDLNSNNLDIDACEALIARADESSAFTARVMLRSTASSKLVRFVRKWYVRRSTAGSHLVRFVRKLAAQRSARAHPVSPVVSAVRKFCKTCFERYKVENYSHIYCSKGKCPSHRFYVPQNENEEKFDAVSPVAPVPSLVSPRYCKKCYSSKTKTEDMTHKKSCKTLCKNHPLYVPPNEVKVQKEKLNVENSGIQNLTDTVANLRVGSISTGRHIPRALFFEEESMIPTGRHLPRELFNLIIEFLPADRKYFSIAIGRISKLLNEDEFEIEDYRRDSDFETQDDSQESIGWF